MLSPLSHSSGSTNVNDSPIILCPCYKDHFTIEHHDYFETYEGKHRTRLRIGASFPEPRQTVPHCRQFGD